MATIRTAIQIEDRLSQPIRAMHNAISMMVNQMEHMNVASGDMFDSSSIELMRRNLANAANSMNQIEREIHAANNAQGGLNNRIRDGTDAMNGLLSKVMTLIGAYLSLRGLGQLIEISDELTNTKARVQLLVEEMPVIPDQLAKVDFGLGDMSDIEIAQQLIHDAAQRSFSSFKDTADMVSRIGTNARDSFGSLGEVVAFTELVQKQFGIAGASAVEASNATIQLSQALASGVLRGDELNSIFEQAPNLISTIADYMGEPLGAIRDLAADGMITADIVKNAMFAATDEINKKFDSMPVTWSQMWTYFQNEALRAFGPVLKQINDVANSERFKEFVSSATQALYLIAGVIGIVMNAIASIGAFIYDNWQWIAPIIFGVGSALLILASYIIIVRTAILLKTAAVWAWNAALAANPIVWVVIAIIALIAIIYLAVAAINDFTGSSISATGIIAGAFMVLGSAIFNVIAYLWNMWASYAEFFVNVWKHPMYSVKRLFYNLSSNVLDSIISMTSGWDNFATNFVNAIVSAVNGAIKAWNWFVDLLPSDIAAKIGIGKGSEIAHTTSITSDLKGLKGALGDWVGEAPADYWEAPKMEMKSLGAAWDTGYNWGADLFNFDKGNTGGNTDALMKSINDALGLGDKLDKGNEAGKKTADNTKKAADGIKMMNEDLKYLRDIAEREAINRYTTAEIKVDMKNENHINSELDVDGIIDKFGERVEEVAEMLAEGGSTDV
ncbi:MULTISPECIES: tape measure protein [Lysinibacillus]|uniref:tape measure protein n=1 Tax=Lysinibacillus TaxID=400634 RepID=UPI00214C160B|nr:MULTISPECIES: tape measure protein [Lysinibacillus]UUV26106.1 tape measure protein [Lysinibacillus sp. FN11]UYB48979.1 tape measure protein [Lysinibacillus capsici]